MGGAEEARLADWQTGLAWGREFTLLAMAMQKKKNGFNTIVTTYHGQLQAIASRAIATG